MTKMRLRIPFVGFASTLFALIASIVALSMYLNLYSVAGYITNWWTVLFSALPILFLVVILVNSVLLADDPFFMIFFHIATAFMLIFGALLMLQPCISEIAFVFGSPDLAMGDNAIRVYISSHSITTTVWYVLAAVFTVVGAFTPNMLMRKEESNDLRIQKAIELLLKYNKKTNKIVDKAKLNVELDAMPIAPVESKDQDLGEKTKANTIYIGALYGRLKNAEEKVRAVSDGSPAKERLDKIFKNAETTYQKAVFSDKSDGSNAVKEESHADEEVNNG